MLCRICGDENCKKHSFLLGKAVKITEFSGSSPPEIFVGKWDYPNVYAGILSPQQCGNTEIFSSHETWHKKRLPIPNILELRNNLIYGRSKVDIKKAAQNPTQFNQVMQEVAMTHKSISAQFKLKNPILQKQKEQDASIPLIRHAAEISKVTLQENPSIRPKVDYLVNDTEVKSIHAIQELDKSGISTSTIMKILSAGLLGLKKNRKLVPTRWSISSVDSILSEKKIEEIKDFPLINEYLVFYDEYIGNHYEIILIPRFWSFEVIEISMKNFGVWKDYESFFKRKTYADSVTGAYYTNRLAVSEYLKRIKKQATILILREIRPEYYAPLGVGILRETTRSAFIKQPNKFNNLQDAFKDAQSRLRIPIDRYLKESQLLKNLQQKTLNSYL
ncbi:MAG: hypothetical protein Q8L29_03750 [archaeon]|nr:hypothetical protein [archaeon]